MKGQNCTRLVVLATLTVWMFGVVAAEATGDATHSATSKQPVREATDQPRLATDEPTAVDDAIESSSGTKRSATGIHPVEGVQPLAPIPSLPGVVDRGPIFDTKSLDPTFPAANLVATIPAQGSVTIEFEVQVKAYNEWAGFPLTQVCDQHTVTDSGGTISVQTDDPAVGGATDPTCLALDTADMSITKTDSADPVVAGAPLSYTVTVSNAGPAAAENVVVTETLPADVTFVSTSGCIEDPVGVPTCSLGNIGNGSMINYSVNVVVNSDATGSITNMATVASAREAAPGNETATESTTLTTQADLVITKTDSADPIDAGSSLVYTITVNNSGPSDAQDVVVTDTLPAGVSNPVTSGCAEDPAGTPTCTLGTISGGGSAMYTITVDVDTDTNGNITNNASVVSSTPLINTGDDMTSEDTEVNGEAELTLVKTDAPDPVLAGEQLTYSFDVSNAGPGSATNTVLCDLLPPGTSYASDTLGACSQPGTLLGFGASLDETAVMSGSPGSGVAAFFLDTNTDLLRYLLEVDGMVNAITSATLRLASDDSLVHDLYAGAPTFDNSNAISGEIQLTAMQSTALQASTHYVDVRTAAFPNGEIRGTLVASASTPVLCDLGSIASAGNTAFDIVVDVAASVADGSVLTNLAVVTSSLNDPNAVVVAPAGEIAWDRARTDTDVDAEADLVITKTDSVDPVVAGNNLIYTITVTNNGPSDALDVVVTDTLPMGVTFLSSSGCVEDPAGAPTCSLGTVSGGGSTMFTLTVAVDPGTMGTLTNNASVTSSTTLTDTGDDMTSEETTVSVESDLVITKTDSVDPVVAGNNLIYTITVTNNGPSIAAGVVVTDTLPVGVTLVSTAGCAEDPAAVPTCTLGSINPSSNAQYTVTVTVDSDTTDDLTNMASVAASTPLINTGDDSTSEDTVVSEDADLSVTKTDSVDPVIAGDPLTYTVTVTNNGPSDAVDVVATDTLPAGVTFVSTSGCTEDPAGVPTCNLGTLGPGAMAQYTISVTVDLDTEGTLTNSVSVTSSTADSVPGNNSTSEDTEAVIHADLSIVKSDSEDPVAGQTYTYTLEVTNNGPSEATGVEVTDVLPSGLVFNSSMDGCTENMGTVTCVIGTLSSGQMATRTFDVDLDPPFPGIVSNTATVDGDQIDPDTDNNSDTEETTLDIDPPTVTNINTVYDTGDGTLEACETVNRNWLQRILVTFNESMFDPVGDSDVDDVTNPANYQLVTAGADRAFQTTACGGAMGDDLTVDVTSVDYDDGTFTADLTLAYELTDELYRLEVCGSTTLVDLAGNSLDGNADGTGGDDFERSFRVDNANRFANGHFDCDLDAWTATSSNPAEIVYDSDDFESSPESGSAQFENLTQSQSFQLDQCVEVVPGGEHQLSFAFRLASDPGVGIVVSRFCDFFDAPACGGNGLGPDFAATEVFESGGVFNDLQTDISAPAQAVSALCGVELSTASGDDFLANVDALTLISLDSIFSDGFESGSTAAWSSAVP